MEFEDMKRIWDQQNNEQLYAFNNEAMFKLVQKKKRSTEHTTDFTEFFLILINLGIGLFLLLVKDYGNIYMYLLGALMVITSAFVLTGRLKRKRRENSFDLSILGELEQSIATASYQVKLSHIVRWYYTLPVGLVAGLSLLHKSSSVGVLIFILVVLFLTWYAGGREHNFYVRKKHELEILRKKLSEDFSREDS